MWQQTVANLQTAQNLYYAERLGTTTILNNGRGPGETQETGAVRDNHSGVFLTGVTRKAALLASQVPKKKTVHLT